MTNNDLCRLCRRAGPLQESHIIPRAIIGLTRDRKLNNRFLECHDRGTRTIQDGPKEFLLCQSCEQRISRYEKYFKEAVHLSRHGIEISQNEDVAIIDNLDYRKMKLFFLSLLWRMSVSSRTEFEAVYLGTSEEDVRQMLDREEPGTSREYTVSAIVPLLNGTMKEGWTTTPFVSTYSAAPGYALILGGILYIMWAARDIAHSPTEFSLNETGRWIMPLLDVHRIPFLREYIDGQFGGQPSPEKTD